MLDPHLYVPFLTAALALTLTPGPDTMFVLGASLGGGTRGGLQASAGILTGLLAHMTLAVLGVSALIAASALAFELLRWAGAGCLLWIGGTLLVRTGRARADSAVSVPAPPAGRLYWQGTLTNLFNPKIAVFYVAFLPQFVSPALGAEPRQLFLLGVSHWLMGVVQLAVVAAGSGVIAARLRRSPALRRALDGVAGVVFVGLAARLMLAERRAP